jgi:hypothetical protein
MLVSCGTCTLAGDLDNGLLWLNAESRMLSAQIAENKKATCSGWLLFTFFGFLG